MGRLRLRWCDGCGLAWDVAMIVNVFHLRNAMTTEYVANLSIFLRENPISPNAASVFERELGIITQIERESRLFKGLRDDQPLAPTEHDHRSSLLNGSLTQTLLHLLSILKSALISI